MTGEIVNLRQVRKEKRRSQAEATAASNRARFGRSRGERMRQDSELDRTRRVLDGAWRDRPLDDGG